MKARCQATYSVITYTCCTPEPHHIHTPPQCGVGCHISIASVQKGACLRTLSQTISQVTVTNRQPPELLKQ